MLIWRKGTHSPKVAALLEVLASQAANGDAKGRLREQSQARG